MHNLIAVCLNYFTLIYLNLCLIINILTLYVLMLPGLATNTNWKLQKTVIKKLLSKTLNLCRQQVTLTLHFCILCKYKFENAQSKKCLFHFRLSAETENIR